MERRSGLLRVVLAAASVGALAASCTSILGVDGDYVTEPGPSGAGGGSGAGGAPSASSAGQGGVTASSSSTATSSSASSVGPGGGGGDGGAGGEGGETSVGGGGSTSTGAGGAGGGVDCDDVLCVNEQMIGAAPPGAHTPRLLPQTTSDARVTVLVGVEHFVWSGLTDGNTLDGGYGADLVADDAVPLDADEVAVLRGGQVGVEVVSALDDIQGPPALGPRLFATRHGSGDALTFHHVASRGQESPFFTCSGATPDVCVEAWGACATSGGPPSHSLVQRGNFLVLGRVCGDERALRVQMNDGTLLPFPARSSVTEVAVASASIPGGYALTITANGPERSVHVDAVDLNGVVSFEGGLAPGAREPWLEVTLERVVGAWIEDREGAAVVRVMRCGPALASCTVRTLHVLGDDPVVDPSWPTIAEAQVGTVLAWQEGAAPDSRVRFALVPSTRP